MRGRLTILLALWICSACSVNENANHGERCGPGSVCTAGEICYRGFCTVDPQSNAVVNPGAIASNPDSGSVSFEEPNAPVDSSGSGPGTVNAARDAGTQAVVSLDSSAPSAELLDAGQPTAPPAMSQGSPEQGPDMRPSSPDAAVPAVSVPLPNDGNRVSVCYNDKPCAKDLFCFAPSGGTRQYPGICADGCRTDANCPAIAGVAQVCSSDGQCHNACGGAENKGDGTCPVNEVCRDVGIAFFASAWVCTYPDDSGSRSVAAYGACSTQHGGGDCANGGFCHAPNGGRSGYCTSMCAAATDCAVPAGTTATPLCAAARCEFDCGAAGKNSCPDKMNCRDVSNNPLASVYRCVFID